MLCAIGGWNTRWKLLHPPCFIREVLALGLGLCALAACDRDTTVPFKRPDPQHASRNDSVAASHDEVYSAATTTPSAPQTQRFADAPSKIQMGKASVDRGHGHIHATLTRTPEQGTQDLLLLASDDDGTLALEYSEEDSGRYSTPRVVLALPAPAAGCQMLTGSLRAPSTAHLIAEASHSCPIVPEASEGEAQALTRTFYILSRETHPRLLERLGVRTASQDQEATSPVALRAELVGQDVDQDGHDDLQLVLTATLGEQTLSPISLSLIDRPGGLVWDAKEPESSLRTLADQAHKMLTRKPEQALALAAQVVAVHHAVCRGNGGALLEVGGHPGIPCERSVAVGRALSIAIAAHSKRGEILEALAAQEDLKSSQIRLIPVDEKRALAAVENLPREGDLVFTEGPILQVPPLPAVHRPQVAFLDEHHLLLRGDPPETYSLTDGTRSPTSLVAPSALLTDPSRRLVATDIVHDCGGDRLRLFPIGQVIMGRSVGTPTAELLIRPGDSACDPTGASSRQSSLRLLRWSSGGLLFANGDKLLVMPVDNDLQNTPPARELQEGETLPPPFEPDTLATARPLYALATSAGIVVVDRVRHSVRLLRSEGLPSRMDNVAFSPSGERLAVLSGSRVWIGQPRTAVP